MNADALVAQGRACSRCGLAPANAAVQEPRSRLLVRDALGVVRCRNLAACVRRRRAFL